MRRGAHSNGRRPPPAPRRARPARQRGPRRGKRHAVRRRERVAAAPAPQIGFHDPDVRQGPGQLRPGLVGRGQSHRAPPGWSGRQGLRNPDSGVQGTAADLDLGGPVTEVLAAWFMAGYFAAGWFTVLSLPGPEWLWRRGPAGSGAGRGGKRAFDEIRTISSKTSSGTSGWPPWVGPPPSSSHSTQRMPISSPMPSSAPRLPQWGPSPGLRR